MKVYIILKYSNYAQNLKYIDSVYANLNDAEWRMLEIGINSCELEVEKVKWNYAKN